MVVLIETQMTLDELKNKFPDSFRIMPFDELLNETETFDRFSKHVTENSDDNYVIVYSESAPFYYLDLRGH